MKLAHEMDIEMKKNMCSKLAEERDNRGSKTISGFERAVMSGHPNPQQFRSHAPRQRPDNLVITDDGPMIIHIPDEIIQDIIKTENEKSKTNTKPKRKTTTKQKSKVTKKRSRKTS